LTIGKFKILLSWCCLGKIWAQTKIDIGRKCESGYDSHYTLVKKKKLEKEFCEIKSFKKLTDPKEGDFYPIVENEKPDADDICVFDSDQLLPFAVITYTAEKKKSYEFN
jgi:hypothetical protein